MIALPDSKFEQEDLPKIHAAIHTAREAKAAGRVTIDVAENGGIIAVQLETKRKFK